MVQCTARRLREAVMIDSLVLEQRTSSWTVRSFISVTCAFRTYGAAMVQRAIMSTSAGSLSSPNVMLCIHSL